MSEYPHKCSHAYFNNQLFLLECKFYDADVMYTSSICKSESEEFSKLYSKRSLNSMLAAYFLCAIKIRNCGKNPLISLSVVHVECY